MTERLDFHFLVLNLAIYPLQVVFVSTNDGDGNYLGGNFKMLGVEWHFSLHNPMFCSHMVLHVKLGNVLAGG